MREALTAGQDALAILEQAAQEGWSDESMAALQQSTARRAQLIAAAAEAPGRLAEGDLALLQDLAAQGRQLEEAVTRAMRQMESQLTGALHQQQIRQQRYRGSRLDARR